jgi:hypothetical protein
VSNMLRKIKRNYVEHKGGERGQFREVKRETLSKDDDWLKHPSFVKKVLSSVDQPN